MEKRGLTVSPDDLTASTRMPGAGVGAGVGLAVLSPDEGLLDTLEEVVTADHAISMCGTESELADVVLGGRVGVAVIDADAIPGSLAESTARLRAQFPDLVLVVAGSAENQGALAAQIAGGQVYRFLHKPVSAQRVRQFIEAALRRHDEEHALVRQAVAAATPPRRARAATQAAGRPPVTAIVAVVVALAAAGAWFALRKPEAPASAAGATTVASTAPAGTASSVDDAASKLLDRADKALARGELVSPAGASASDLYREVLRRYPTDARAVTGFDKTINELLTGAEQAILAGRLDDAARQIESARNLQPDNVRIAFLSTQLGRERERALLTRARTAAASGDLSQALAVLDNKASEGVADTGLVAEARRALERQQVDARVRDVLRLAAERVQRGNFTEPASDNARFYIETARAIAPRDASVARASEALGNRVLSEARAAVGRGDSAAANRLLRNATELGLPASEIDALRAQLATALNNGRSNELSRLSSLVSQRIAQGRLLDPPGESARSAFASLAEIDGSGTVAQGLRQALGRAYLDEARAAIARNDAPVAARWLTETESLNAGATDAAALGGELADLRNRLRLQTQVVGASTLKRIRSIEPDYPRAARAARVEGWVDLEFSVLPDGAVGAVKVVASAPAGTFDGAAVDAVRRWRFQPVMRDGIAVEQRTRLRMRFNLE